MYFIIFCAYNITWTEQSINYAIRHSTWCLSLYYFSSVNCLTHRWIFDSEAEKKTLFTKILKKNNVIEKSREKFNRKEKNNGNKGRSDIKTEFEPFARPSWRKHKHTYTSSIRLVFLLIWQNQFKSQELIIDRNRISGMEFEWSVNGLSLININKEDYLFLGMEFNSI